MDAAFRDDAPNRKRGAATSKFGKFTTTGTTLGIIWTPATGLTLRIYEGRFAVYCSTALVGATIGDPILMVDNVIANTIIGCSYLGASGYTVTAAATLIGQLGRVVAGTDAATVFYGYFVFNFGTSGIKLGAKNNSLKFGCANTIGSGVITAEGTVLGIEENL